MGVELTMSNFNSTSVFHSNFQTSSTFEQVDQRVEFQDGMDQRPEALFYNYGYDLPIVPQSSKTKVLAYGSFGAGLFLIIFFLLFFLSSEGGEEFKESVVNGTRVFSQIPFGLMILTSLGQVVCASMDQNKASSYIYLVTFTLFILGGIGLLAFVILEFRNENFGLGIFVVLGLWFIGVFYMGFGSPLIQKYYNEEPAPIEIQEQQGQDYPAVL